MKFQIKTRYTGRVQFECELDASPETESYGAKLGAAIKLALKARADLADANLADADLADAYLADADLAGANLARASLARANLADANLARADLADANLADANLAGADLAGADLTGASLASADLANTDVIDGGQERRGFRFWAWRHPSGHVVYRAGCREWPSLDAALAHFNNNYESTGDRHECIARLRLVEICAKQRGWIREG